MNTSLSGNHIEGQVGDQAKNFIIGKGNIQTVIEGEVSGTVNIYADIQPHAIDQATINAALAKLGELPLDTIPAEAALPTGSRILFSRNPLFVGREQELRMLATLLKGGTAVAVGPTTAVTGMGGIGKTQLAVTFVHHYGQFFSGGVYWLNFADPTAVPAEIAACGLTMPELRIDFATQDQMTQVRLVLGAWQSVLPRLLIFDNCELPALLAQWRPPSGGCRVLITSRHRRWAAGLGVRALALDTLRRTQSIELLHKFPDASDMPPFIVEEAPTLNDIAEELGDLPLALHLAGSYLTNYRYAVSPATYLDQLRSPDLLHHPSLQADDFSPTLHDQHVARTFALSYEQLDPANDIDTLALALLARTACFAPGLPIPRFLFVRTVAQESDNPDGERQVEAALHRLTDLGLIERARNGAVLLHRLIAVFVQSTNREGHIEAQNAVESAILIEADRINDGRIPGPLQVWQLHLRHVTDTAKIRADQTSAGLCNELGIYLKMVGELASARHYYERALAINEEVLGAKHPDTANSLNNLGAVFLAMGELAAARPYVERALAIREEVLGAKHPDTANSLSNLGVLLDSMGELAAGRPYLERALAIREEVLGAKHPDTANSLGNLGYLLLAMGNLVAARPYFERALAIREEVLGAKHPDTANSLSNLGALLDSMGELTAARHYYERALAINEEVLGAKHPDTAGSLINMGYLLLATGDLAAAQPYYERALAIREEVLGAKHPDTANSLNNLGYLLQTTGDLAAAQPYYERALAIREEVLGAKHPATANSLNNLGYLLFAMGELAAARPYFERALAIQEEVLGTKHPDMTNSLNNLGLVLQTTGDLAAARPYFERALAIREEVLGAKHPATAISLGNLGGLLFAMRNLAAARPYFERALAIQEEVLGTKHPDMTNSLINMGYLLQATGNLVAAQPYYEHALAIFEERLGPSHDYTETLRRKLAALHQEMQYKK